MKQRARFLGCTLIVLLACTGGTTPEPTGQATQPSAIGSDAPFVRTCDSSVFGPLGRGWIQGSIVVGPAVFVGGGYRHARSSTFDLKPGKAASLKVLLVVHGAELITLSIPSSVSEAALSYDPASFNTNRLEEGQRAVTFQPCGGGPQHTQFNGAFLVSRPLCLPIEVAPAGAATITAEIPLGEACDRPA